MPGGAARISVQTTEGGAPGDGAAALSPLGQHVAARRPQWDSAAALAPAPPPPHQPALSREFSARLGGSPAKRIASSLRASAPAFSGYASVALSQQSELLVPRLARPAAGGSAAQEPQPAGAGALRGSRESVVSGAASSAAAGPSDTSSEPEQPELRRSYSNLHSEAEATSLAAVPAVPATEVPARQAEQAAAPEALLVQEQSAEEALPGPTPSETPAALRHRPGVQDLLQREAQQAGPAGATPGSAGNSSGTNKVRVGGRVGRCRAVSAQMGVPCASAGLGALPPASMLCRMLRHAAPCAPALPQSDYNPMEEPSWLHPHESPLLAEETPTSGLAGGSPPQRAPAAARSPEASSFAATGASQPRVGAAAVGAKRPAPAQDSTAAAASGYDQHPSAEHMVWTNEDGDIDALPWDMGGWSTGSSAERAAAEQQEQEAPALQPRQQNQQQRKPSAVDQVDEDALIGALHRKVGMPGSLASCAPGCLRISRGAGTPLQRVVRSWQRRPACPEPCFLAPCCRPSTMCAPPWPSLKRASTSLRCTSRPRPSWLQPAATAAALARSQRCAPCRHSQPQRCRWRLLSARSCTLRRRASRAWGPPRSLGLRCVQRLQQQLQPLPLQ